jgi:FAD/FMN-containing dehydrogenase
LIELVGEENVSAAPLVATPASIAEVCEVMKLAHSEGWTTMPAGAMSWLRHGEALAPNLIVSTRRLNRLIEHEPADLVAITEAGVTLNDFNAHLSSNRQWLPIDPPDDGSVTIGGVVATGVAGAQQFGYGPPRRHVIGMKVVLADGSLIKAGARVVKNVAGYDLCKLFTGSYGTLGIIVEVNFKLRPLPLATQTVLISGQPEELLAGAQRIIQAPLFPVAVELVSAKLMSQLTETTPGVPAFLMIRFAGSTSAVAAQISRTRELIKIGSTRLVDEDQAIWTALQALPIRFSERFMWRVGLRPTEAASFLLNLIKTTGAATMWQASLGDGRIRVIDEGGADDCDLNARIKDLSASAEARGGSIIIESGDLGPAQLNRNFGSGIMRKIKEQLDPHNIFTSPIVA